MGEVGGGSARIETALFDRATISSRDCALVDGERRLTYAQLAELADRLRARLQAIGVAAGDRVVTYLDKTVESVASLYAIWAAGAIAVPANESLRARQVWHIIDDSGAKVVVATPGKWLRLRLGTPEGLRVLDPGAEGDVDRAAVAAPAALRTGDEPAAILYTSGSTGLPKGILISHANLVAGARIVSSYLGLRGDDRLISILPFSFDYGLNQLLTSVRQGATLVLQRSHFSPDVCRTLDRERVTVMAAVPPLWIQLMDPTSSPFASMSFPALRTLTNSGGAFPIPLVARYREHLPHARLFLMYGLSEAFRSSYLPPELLDAKPGSMGRAIPETELFVVGDDGRPCGVDEPGELVHRGPTVALGYWRNPEATREKFRPDPFDRAASRPVVYSGDLVRRDEDGCLYFLGRRDQQIKTQGYRVSPEEVEELLHASGLVREAIARGEPDAHAGSVVVVHVVPHDPATFAPEALLAFCRREMPAYMVPRDVRVHEALPRTPSGKLDRKAVAP